MGILTLRFIWRLFRIRLRPKPSPAVRPRSAPTPFVLGCEPKGACLLLLGFKLVRGLVDSALGWRRLAANELVLRKPTHGRQGAMRALAFARARAR